MDLNGIKSRAQRVKAPPPRSAPGASTSDSLEHLTARLRAADQREQSGLRKAAPLFAFVAAGLFLVLVITTFLPPMLPPAGDIVFRVVIFSVFLLLAVESLRRSRQMAEIDYAAPTRQFLEASERRYRFMGPRHYLVAAVGCVLVGAVTGVHVINAMMDRYFGPQYLTLAIASFCVFFVGLVVMGFVFTYQNWKRDKRPLWLEIREMLAELSAEEADATPAA